METSRSTNNKSCSVTNCSLTTSRLTAGMCVTHYNRKRRYGDPTVLKIVRVEKCLVSNCNFNDNRGFRLGYCTPHYRAFKLYDDPLGEHQRRTNGKLIKQYPRSYETWRGMRQRVTNPNHEHYHYYGGRGIKLHESWNVFANFVADMGERPEGMTLDRKNFNGNYEPSNCKWADPVTQANNRRNSIKKCP